MDARHTTLPAHVRIPAGRHRTPMAETGLHDPDGADF